ncbi:MAG: transglycosylase SLT domain-containing protein [Lentisphaeria bacterium]
MHVDRSSKKISDFPVAVTVRFLLALAMLVYALGLLKGLVGGQDYVKVYDKIIHQAANRHSLPPSLIKAVIRKESKFRPWAAGKDGEIGLMQIRRAAVTDWERHSGRQCEYNGMLTNPRLNIEIGSWYLGRAFNHWIDYRDAEVLALAEYNAGRTAARKWAPDDKRERVINRVSYTSTKEYIKSIIRYRELYLN